MIRSDAPHALVTGAGRGIGLACAKALDATGWRVTLVARNASRLAGMAAALNPGTDFLSCDLANARDIAAATLAYAERHARLDLLVNAAGVLTIGRLAEQSEAAIDAMLATNLRATILLVRALLPLLGQTAAMSSSAAIANIASISALRGDAGFAAYCASKFGLRGCAEALADEVAGTGIAVTTLFPGPVDTEMGAWAHGVIAPSAILTPAAVADRLLAALAAGPAMPRNSVQPGRPRPMIFYLQMRWNVEGRLDNDALWELEALEGTFAQGAVDAGIVRAIYKVAGQRRVIAIVDLPDAETLDRTIMAGLPMAQYLEFEAIWPLREYAPFIEDCRTGFADAAGAVA